MSFTFIHTADWQIGKPFGGFPSDKQGVLRQARLDVIDNIADVAQAHGAHHVLVGGDVFDTTRLADAKIQSLLQRLALFAQVTWHLLPGNHDFAATDGFWHRVKKLNTAKNVVIHDEPTPFEAEAGVVILPAPLKARTALEDPTQWMDEATTPKKTLRIGLAHGAVQGFGSAEEASVMIAPTRDKTAKLDYLALGDWHGMLKITDRVWYSGTPEPDRYPSNNPGHVLVVTLPGGTTPPVVEPVETRSYIWRQQQIEVSSIDDVEQAIEDVKQLGPDVRRLLLRLDLSGVLSLSEINQVEDLLNELRPSVYHLDDRMDDVQAAAQDNDLQAIGQADVRRAAERLQQKIADSAGHDRSIAEHALRLLFRFSQQAGETR